MSPLRSPLRRAVVVIALLLAGAAAAADTSAKPEARPAAGGVRIFHTLEASPVSVVGIVRAPTALDDASYAAKLQVEVLLAGPVERGAELPFVWEERSRSRQVRFRDGDRLLVSLTRLPGASIWRQRLPDGETRVRHWMVAERGDAFVRDPTPGAAKLIEHFLALPPELRDGNPGVAHLARLAEGSTPVLAYGAVERLAGVAALDAALDPVTSRRLVAALIRGEERISGALLDIIGAQRPEALRGPLAAHATPDGRGPADTYAALGRLDGGLDEGLARVLLDRGDSAGHRRVGARYAGRELGRRLARLVREDPAADVRSAAVVRLVELDGVAVIDRVLFALGDDEQTVRATAMQEIGGLGAEAVPALRATVDGGSAEAARTAVAALRATGPTGVEALREVAASHPDASVRLAADIALGRNIGHQH